MRAYESRSRAWESEIVANDSVREEREPRVGTDEVPRFSRRSPPLCPRESDS